MKVRAPLVTSHLDGTRPSTVSVAKTLGAVSAIGALVARRGQLVHVIVEDEAEYYKQFADDKEKADLEKYATQRDR